LRSYIPTRNYENWTRRRFLLPSAFAFCNGLCWLLLICSNVIAAQTIYPVRACAFSTTSTPQSQASRVRVKPGKDSQRLCLLRHQRLHFRFHLTKQPVTDQETRDGNQHKSRVASRKHSGNTTAPFLPLPTIPTAANLTFYTYANPTTHLQHAYITFYTYANPTIPLELTHITPKPQQHPT
jgi:hypothetical protein